MLQSWEVSAPQSPLHAHPGHRKFKGALQTHQVEKEVNWVWSIQVTDKPLTSMEISTFVGLSNEIINMTPWKHPQTAMRRLHGCMRFLWIFFLPSFCFFKWEIRPVYLFIYYLFKFIFGLVSHILTTVSELSGERKERVYLSEAWSLHFGILSCV